MIHTAQWNVFSPEQKDLSNVFFVLTSNYDIKNRAEHCLDELGIHHSHNLRVRNVAAIFKENIRQYRYPLRTRKATYGDHTIDVVLPLSSQYTMHGFRL
jgi:hypothetical protein